MNCLSAAVAGFRSGRKSFSISGSLLLTALLLLVGQAAARPSDEILTSFDLGDEYADVDNVEIHHVKLVDGLMTEDHPIVMYKEDFVSEDYKPVTSTTNSSKPEKNLNKIVHRHRKHSQQNRQNQTENAEQYHTLKPEKMYFDVLPEQPLAVATDSDETESKFDASKIHVEIISLADEENAKEQTEEPAKQLLSKRPKKFRSKRTRRDTDGHSVHKRNPYYRTTYAEPSQNSIMNFLKNYYESMHPQLQIQTQNQPQRHPVQGKLWNALDLPVEPPTTQRDMFSVANRFGSLGEEDRVIWPNTAERRPAERRPASRRPAFTTSAPFTTTRRPASPKRPSLFHDSDPNNADFSFFTPANRRPTTATTSGPFRQPETAARAPGLNGNGDGDGDDVLISQCVWAIVNCCSNRDSRIRYHCFEQLGCHGSFWGLNPCADNIRDNVINYVSDISN